MYIHELNRLAQAPLERQASRRNFSWMCVTVRAV